LQAALADYLVLRRGLGFALARAEKLLAQFLTDLEDHGQGHRHRGGRLGVGEPARYNKRMRKAGPLLARVMRPLATLSPSWQDQLRLIDSTPVPCAASRERVKRSDLARDAGYGYCASHSRFLWGFRLYLLATPDGMPVIWGLANPKLGEREVNASPASSRSSPGPCRAGHPGR
jgi:hypothetical protein